MNRSAVALAFSCLAAALIFIVFATNAAEPVAARIQH